MISKIANNLFSPGIFHTLGYRGCLQYLIQTALNAPQIIAERSLRPLDKAMRNVNCLSIHGKQVFFDCTYCDDHIAKDDYIFGIIREIFIRGCYFKFLPDALKDLGNVVDLGANRGAFTSAISPFAQKILSVEAQPIFRKCIEYHIQLNNHPNARVETAFIGSAGSLKSDGYVALSDLLDKAGMDTIDLIKIDIEGGEFGLFQEEGWLNRVCKLSMEVHHAYGEPRELVDRLMNSGFNVNLADADLNPQTIDKHFDFVYAWH